MKGAIAIALLGVLLLIGLDAKSQGFVDEPTCYSWNGGHKSAGSYSKCNPPLLPVVVQPVAVATPVTTPTATPSPVVQSTPIMMPVCVNPVPPDKPKPKRRYYKPKPHSKCS
jgi:hypothetical protein